MEQALFERCEPLVAPAGDAAEYQVSDAYDARWVAPLVDGTFALVTRTYYIAHLHGETFVERQDEYLICRDPADPGGTEVGSELTYAEVDSIDPAREDPYSLAHQSFAPEPAEWRANAPQWSPHLLEE